MLGWGLHVGVSQDLSHALEAVAIALVQRPSNVLIAVAATVTKRTRGRDGRAYRVSTGTPVWAPTLYMMLCTDLAFSNRSLCCVFSSEDTRFLLRPV